MSDSEADSEIENGEPLDIQKLFEAASKVKSGQLAKIRKEYETSPMFIRGTQLYNERNKYDQLSITDKIKQSETLKNNGNDSFKNKKFKEAKIKYTEAISLFYYFMKTDSKGEALKLIDLISIYPQNFKSMFQNNIKLYIKSKELLINLLLNCAISCIKLNEIDDTIWCCHTILNKYDNQNIKALYRLCEAYEILDTTLDLESAFKYISKAKKITGKTNKIVTQKYNKIKKQLQIQNKKDRKTFQGLFNRGNLYNDKQIIKQNSNIKLKCRDKIFQIMSQCVIL